MAVMKSASEFLEGKEEVCSRATPYQELAKAPCLWYLVLSSKSGTKDLAFIKGSGFYQRTRRKRARGIKLGRNPEKAAFKRRLLRDKAEVLDFSTTQDGNPGNNGDSSVSPALGCWCKGDFKKNKQTC